MEAVIISSISRGGTDEGYDLLNSKIDLEFDHTKETFFEFCNAENSHIIQIEGEGYVIFSSQRTKAGNKKMTVDYAWGSMESGVNALRLMEEVAIDNDIKRIFLHGRVGWAKWQGFKRVSTTSCKEI